MAHVAFFEPAWSSGNLDDWDLRGGYKYPSLIGGLTERAGVTLVMPRLPPADDPHRRALQSQGVRFRELNSLNDPTIWAADQLARDMARAIDAAGATIGSMLNARLTGFNVALAGACRAAAIPYVFRVAANDIQGRGAVLEQAGTAYWGSSRHAADTAQERLAIALAARVIVMSNLERKRVVRLGADPSVVTICQRGVDRAHFVPVGEPPRCTRFLYVGRNSFEKGIDRVEAAADALEGSAPALTFTFAGGGFTPRTFRNRRYRDYVPYARLPALYADHHALLCCARSEGFPQVVMEAMACGLPTILSRSLFADDFTDQVDCLLVDDAQRSVTAAVERLASDPELHARIRRNGLTRAARDFDASANRHAYHRALLGDA